MFIIFIADKSNISGGEKQNERPRNQVSKEFRFITGKDWTDFIPIRGSSQVRTGLVLFTSGVHHR